jgi:hypothetical protein
LRASTSALLRTVTATSTTSPSSRGTAGVATISLVSIVRSRLNVVHHQGRLNAGSGLL